VSHYIPVGDMLPVETVADWVRRDRPAALEYLGRLVGRGAQAPVIGCGCPLCIALRETA
jgi:hypothetical protein